jgi:hypothetical protein
MFKVKIEEVKDLAEKISSLESSSGVTIPKMSTQANSTATDIAGLVADFNALLSKLKSAGFMA